MKATAMRSLTLLLFMCVLWISPSLTLNPGFRVILTTKGMNYAHQAGLMVLKEWLCHEKIPTLNYTSEVGTATVEYNFTNVIIHSLGFGKSSLTSDSRGFVLTDDGVSISASTEWRIREDAWPYFTDNGLGNLSVRSVSVSISSDVLSNLTTGGHFAVNVTGCSFHIDDIDVVFSGGASFMYNMFGLAINEFLEHELNKKACVQFKQWINTYGNKYVSSLPVVLSLTDGVAINYSLVADANFTHKGRVITDHKGEFIISSNPSGGDPPLHPPHLPDPSEKLFNDSKMVYVIATKYVAESASYAFWKANRLVYNVSSETLQFFDNTDFWCASTLLPQELCDTYPGMKVMLGLVASDYPRLNVTSEYAVMHGEANVSMYVDNGGTEEIAFTLSLTAQADVDPYFDNTRNHICAKVSNTRLSNISLVYSTIGQFDCTVLKDLINAALPGLCPLISKYTETGFPIPVEHGVTFENWTLQLGKGYVVIGSDIRYSQDSKNITCIYKEY